MTDLSELDVMLEGRQCTSIKERNEMLCYVFIIVGSQNKNKSKIW